MPMATNQLSRVIQALRQVTLPQEETTPTDGQLLESYVSSRQEAAFAALVRRHGPMVWGVCRRVLGSHHDAEDAFQATFLVLVRKAPSVLRREMVANWLYGVAHRTALKARAIAARRRGREMQVPAMSEPAHQPHDPWDDLQPLLDKELSHLPDKYRAVIVLCDLDGKTRKETARHLKVPEGTVASRLATARSMLAKRLARRGVVLSTTALATLVSRKVALAGVPLSVASDTIKAATAYAAGPAAAGPISANVVALAEGVLKTMLLNKLKIATAVLVAVAFLGTGAAVYTHQLAEPASQERQRPERAAEKPADQPVKEKKEPAATPVNGNKQAEARPTFVSGVVKAVAAEKGTLTIQHKEGEGTYTMANGARIEIDGKAGQLGGLPVGAHVTLRDFADSKTAGSIQAHGSSIFAAVKAVDVEKSTITARGGPSDGQTFLVTKDTRVTVDDKLATLADIPVGASLHALNLCVDQKTASSINVNGPGFQHVPVKTVDAEKNTITFDAKAPADLAGKTFAVAKDANLHIDGKPGKLAAVPSGSFANVGLSVDKSTARHLDVEGASLGGCGGSLVKAVDTGVNTITFDDKALAEVAGKTFTVANGAYVMIDGRPGKLSELPVGSNVNLTLTVDGKTARQVFANGPRFSGIVKAVDPERSNITVEDKSYPVAKDAIIVIDGKVGALSGLKAGSSVNLNLRVDQKTVGMIQTTAMK
jgi:RNA polymerase sigma factor (sigma-70 family)